MTWKPNTLAPSGTRTIELDHHQRKAVVNVSPLPADEYVVSLSLVVRARHPDEAKRIAEVLLVQHADEAVPL